MVSDISTLSTSPVSDSTACADGRRLRVCHLSLGLSTGGLERLLVDFARFHDPSRFELTFAAMHDVGRPAEEIRATGCDVLALNLKSRTPWQRVRELARLFRERGIDVVHTHNATPYLYGTAAARWAGVPAVIQTRHGQRFGHGWLSKLRFRWITHYADRVVAVSDDAARLCSTQDGIRVSKVSRIWNGIDLTRFRFRGPSKQPRAISVARLSPEKDFPTLLRAVALVIRQIPDFQLQIVGGGSERPMLDRLVDELKLSRHVQLLGERNDIPELLSEAGFFVSSSLTEGVSLTLLEAMAVGLPILATDVGGNPEVIQAGVTGYLMPPKAPAVIARAIIDMCREKSTWPALGRAGRDRVERHFDVRQMLHDYEDLYENLVAGRRRL